MRPGERAGVEDWEGIRVQNSIDSGWSDASGTMPIVFIGIAI